MTARKAGTVKGADMERGQVVKIGGRWLRIVEWFDRRPDSDIWTAVVAPHNHDPRLANRVTGKYRIIWPHDEYLTRDEPAPAWDWVTRKIERESKQS